jgi:5-methylthioadenosine/S-adenosylhomocysteine deaminase
MDWLQKYIFPAEAKTVSPEFVRIGTQLALLEMIQSGTTTFADMYYFEEEVAKVTKAAGMRGVPRPDRDRVPRSGREDALPTR